jgi:hypothetical protein
VGVTQWAQEGGDASLRQLVLNCPLKESFSRETEDYDSYGGESCR